MPAATAPATARWSAAGPVNFHHLPNQGQAAAGGDAPALRHGEDLLSYSQLIDRAAAVSAGLRDRLDLRRGDRVAIFLEKRIETVLSMLGASGAGAIFVPVNPVLKPAQVAHILADSGTRALVTSSQRLGQLGEALADCPALEAVVLVDGNDEAPDDGTATADLAAGAPASGGPRSVSWRSLTAGGEAAGEPPDPGTIDLDPAAIFYTSGSTGRPKGVVVSHRNLIAGAESVNGYLGNGPGDRILAALPLSFDAGFSQLSTAFASGAEVIVLDYLLPRDVVRVCAEHQVTGLTCVPPLWIQLAEADWPEEASRSLRYFASTGGRMPPPTLERLRAIFPQALPFLMYGLTEAFRSTFLDPAEVDRRPGSIGKAIPNAEVLVLRPDGSECDPGEQGELVHRGALVSLGYWNDPERTAERFRPIRGRGSGAGAGELAVWSGDAVVRDEDGFLFFVERSDEMIKTSGYRLSPTEIEDAAYATKLVAEAVAIGLPDQRLGQAVVLVVSPAQKDGDAGMRDAGEFDPKHLLRQLKRELPRFMLPGRVEAMPALPRSPNGKFDRQAIRRMLETAAAEETAS